MAFCLLDHHQGKVGPLAVNGLPAGLQPPIPSVKIVSLLPNYLDPVQHPGAREAILFERDVVIDPPAIWQGKPTLLDRPVILVKEEPFPVNGLLTVLHLPLLVIVD